MLEAYTVAVLAGLTLMAVSALQERFNRDSQ